VITGVLWALLGVAAASASPSSAPRTTGLSTSSKSVPAASSGTAIPLPARHAGVQAQGRATVDARAPLSLDPAALAKTKAAAADRAALAQGGTGTSKAPPTASGPYDVYNSTNFVGLSDPNVTPSDSTGAMGPNHYVEMVNTIIGVVPRGSTTFSTEVTLNNFGAFNASDCTTDPQISWDQEGGRWLYSFLELDPACAGNVQNYLDFGWSISSDPSNLISGWCNFVLNTGTYLFDYDKLGHDNNYITIGANVFSGSTAVTGIIVVIAKPANGQTACNIPTFTTFGSPQMPLLNADGTMASTPVPAVTTDSSAVGYIVAAHNVDSGPSTLIMEWHVSCCIGGAPILTEDGDVTVASFGVPPAIPQPATGTSSCSTTGNCLDSLDGRLTEAIARFDPDTGTEAIWTQHAITDAAVSTRSVERWYELKPGQMTPYQSGDISDPNLYIFNGSVTPTGAGNEAVINYNAGDGSTGGYASMRAQSRNHGSPLGTMANETIIASSVNNDDDLSCGVNRPPISNPCRWGDYSAARLDPNDANVVWMTNMLTGSGGSASTIGWDTEVAAFTPGCSTATVSPNTGSAFSGSINLFTASATGCSNPEFAFYLQNVSTGVWTLQQAFSSTSTWNWDSAGFPAGDYVVHVWANQTGDSLANWEAIGSGTFHLNTSAPCSAPVVSPTNPSQAAGSTVNFSTAVSGCSNPIYAYFIQDPAGRWTLARPYSTDPTFNWSTTDLVPGAYTVHVWTTQRGTSTNAYQAFGSDSATLTGCSSASASPSVASPQTIGTPVTFTASSTGCPNPLYEFFLMYPNGTWVMEQAFSTTTTWPWNTSGLPAGTYTIHVWANQQGAALSPYEAVGGPSFTLSAPPPCTTASLTPPSPSAPAGSTVGLTASSTGCASPQYAYYVQYPDTSWHLAQDFSSSTAFNWNTSGLAPGLYTVHAWASSTGAGHDAIGSASVTLTGCTSATASPSLSSPQPVGTSITFTAGAVGCSPAVFEFWLQYPDGTWHLEQAWSTTASWLWSTTGLPKGTYTLHVWANQQGASTATYETIGSASFTLN